jgi:hypothetical protein
MFDIGFLRNELTSYVQLTQFRDHKLEIKKLLETFAPWDSLRNVLNEFAGYVKQEDYNNLTLHVN